MRAKQEQPMISNEAKKTRDQPNLTECQSCGLRISSHKRLEILYSEWRIILLCTKCFNLVESSRICSYCFRQSSDKTKCFRCCQCKRVVHKSCFAKRKAVTPWSYSSCDGGGDFSVCIDCWVPNSVASKRGGVCRDSKRNSGRVLGRSLEDANCVVQEKVEAAVRARDLAVRKALEERNEADVARKALDMVANNGFIKENNDVDDFELAFQLHRAINSSPRISSNLCLVNSSCLGVARRGEGNGKTRITNSDFRNPSAYGKLNDFLSKSVDLECRKSNGIGDGKIRANAKKDGNAGKCSKMGEQSFFSKLIDSRGNDHSVNSGSQSFRERNESMTPDDKSCKRKNDRYLLKYSRRKLDESSSMNACTQDLHLSNGTAAKLSKAQLSFFQHLKYFLNKRKLFPTALTTKQSQSKEGTHHKIKWKDYQQAADLSLNILLGYMWFSRDPVDPRRTVYVVFGIYAE
ncbi:hypothetical protein NC653_028696 [Populus alba x Populus x berolinensis]|uniref:Uncharacterized protein n=1 Tax=Populus alba x Populus x berolinensis TaxID=444605 RepID=A0AAD6M0R1_9ROSI|nr:hypothetical protein NC653_028696 [Populus alba x Populus x berolinensis]